MSEIVDSWGRPYNVEHHRIMSAIFYHHMEANPIQHSEEYLAEQREARDRLIEKLKAQGKRIILVKADWLEECGRYVCDGDDGVNGYEPLPGSVTLEEEV